MSDADERFVAERPRLIGLAYRMVGSISDAEDVVSDVYLRWRGLPHDEVANPAAYLTTMTTRRALDRLRQRSRERADYVGPWLPEPVPTAVTLGPAAPGDPADAVVLAESLTLGFLTVLDRLEPAQRAAFLLHDVFGESYAEVAAAVQRSEVTCRQLVHRARRQLAEARRPPRTVDPARSRALLDAFGLALVSGDVAGLQRCLADDVVMVSDGGAKRRAARHPVLGRHRVSRLLLGVTKRAPAGVEVLELNVNNEPALFFHLDGVARGVLVFEVADRDGGETIAALRMILNDEKLGAFTALLAPPDTASGGG